jgi:TonB family protein
MKDLQQKQELDVRKQTQSRLEELLRKYPNGEIQKRLREMLAELEAQGPESVARLRELEKSAEAMQKSATDRKAKVIYKVEPTYTEDARAKQIAGTVVLGFTVDHEGLPQNIQVKKSLFPSLDQSAIAALRQWRFEPGIKDGQPVSTYLVVEMYFTIESKRMEQEQKEKERTGAGKGEGAGEGNGEGSGSGPFQMKRRRDASDQGREERARRQVEMTRGATISMDRAVQIAVSQYPGKVLAASLGREGDKIFYHLVIINTDGDKSTTTYVWLSATDGQIFKTEKERESREQQW